MATICTNRSAAELRERLAALVAQAAEVDGARALLVTSGLGPREHAEHERLAAELGATALAAGPGLSVARNRAAAAADDADVVAFLDDDAIPRRDWLPRLAARWAEAGEDVACIGGAIEPRPLAAAPAWFSERIWSAFSVFDRGPGLLELAPSRGEDVWGANVSFRVRPLRRVGGFDPARGPWRGVPLFGDESDAERRLERAGMRVLYAGDVRVEHLIGADRLRLRAVAGRQLWRGVSDVLRGARAPRGGPPRLVKAGAGLLLALLRRDWPLAGERWARLWKESGVAAAPLLKRRLRSRGWPG